MTETHEPAAVLAAAMTDEALLDEHDPLCLRFVGKKSGPCVCWLIRAARQEVIDAVLAEHPARFRQFDDTYQCGMCREGMASVGEFWVTDPLDRCATVRALRPWIKEEA